VTAPDDPELLELKQGRIIFWEAAGAAELFPASPIGPCSKGIGDQSNTVLRAAAIVFSAAEMLAGSPYWPPCRMLPFICCTETVAYHATRRRDV
jgi:hypothetical protein